MKQTNKINAAIVLLFFLAIMQLATVKALSVNVSDVSFDCTTSVNAVINITNDEATNITIIGCQCDTNTNISCTCSLTATTLEPNESITGTITLSMQNIKDVQEGNYIGSITVNYSNTTTNLSKTQQFNINVNACEKIAINFAIDDMYKDEQQEVEVTISNEGNTAVNFNLTIEHDAGIEVNLSETQISLNYGESKTITMNISTVDAEYKQYSITITGTKDDQTLGEATESFEVLYSYCSINSVNDWLELDFENKDEIDGETYKPLDQIEIKLYVENNDDEEHDIIVSAVLVGTREIYDSEEEQSIELEEAGEDDSALVKLTLTIPADIYAGDYKLYVKASDEDSNECLQEYADIKIEKESHEVIIDKVSFSPQPVNCGDNMLVSGRIANIGLHDEDKVLIAYEDDLGNKIEKTTDLDEGDEDSFLFNINIPENADEGEHTAKIYVYYDYDEDDDNYDEYNVYSYSFEISGGCISKVYDISVNAETTTIEQQQNQVTVMLTNTGNTLVSGTIAVSCDWANVSVTPATVTLQPGEQASIVLTITPYEWASGEKTITLTITYDQGIISKTINFNIVKPESEETKKATWFDELLFVYKRRPVLMTLIVVLAIATITLAVIVAKQARVKRTRERIVRNF